MPRRADVLHKVICRRDVGAGAMPRYPTPRLNGGGSVEYIVYFRKDNVPRAYRTSSCLVMGERGWDGLGWGGVGWDDMG